MIAFLLLTGAIATPKILQIVAALPKTRSGKVMRRVLRALSEKRDLGDLSTIEDGASVVCGRSVILLISFSALQRRFTPVFFLDKANVVTSLLLLRMRSARR